MVQLVDLLLARCECKLIKRNTEFRSPILWRNDLTLTVSMNYSALKPEPHNLDDAMFFAVALMQELNVAHGVREFFLSGVHFESGGELRSVLTIHLFA